MYLSEYFSFCKIDCNFATDFARLCCKIEYKLLYSTEKLAKIVSIQNQLIIVETKYVNFSKFF